MVCGVASRSDGIALRQQRQIERALRLVSRTLQVAFGKLRGLVPDDLERIGRQRGMQFVVRQQFHALVEILLQHPQVEFDTAAFATRRCRRVPSGTPGGRASGVP